MTENRVVALRQKGAIDDPLTEILRTGARRLIAQAVEAEFETFLASTAELVLPDGRQRVVRHGSGSRDPDRNRPGRSAKAEGPRSRRRFGGAPSLLIEHPAQMGAAHQEPRRPVAGSLSARDFRRRFPGGPRRLARQGRAQPLRCGDRAPQERVGGRISAMAEARFVGAPLRLRLGGRRLFAGAPGAAGRMHAGADGRDGGRQEGADRLSDGHAGERAKLEGAARRFEGARLGRRAASGHWRWRARVLEGPRRGVPHDASSAMLAAQDIERARQAPEVDATQRAQGSARDLAVAEPGAAEAAMTTFAEKYAPKYDKAVECLIKDRQTLLTFFDLPADHWDHLRTSNPIESVFATVRHRTVRMKGALSQDTARLMVFKLVMAASRTWRRLQGQNQLPKVVNGIKFKDGIEAVAEIKSAA